MTDKDCAIIAGAFEAQGWDKPVSQYRDYFRESRAGARVVLVAGWEGQFAGYVTVVWESGYPPFQADGVPEIADLNVLTKYRRLGIGTALMDAAEMQILERSPTAGLGVGLTSDYGPAQVLYVRRGYVPDGRGLFQAGRHLKHGDRAVVDDGLTLYLTRALR
jgi:GNAT superfamily N-acetyltransferase